MVRDILTKNRYTNYYNSDGTPAHEVESSDGKKRVKVTVTHARKLGLYPSVTNILSIIKKEALEDWKQEQLVKACLKLQRGETESEYDYVNRVVDLAFAKSEDAKDFGTEVHYFIQNVLQGKERALYEIPFVTQENIRKCFADVVSSECEKPLVSTLHGYAGRSDCRSVNKDGVSCRWEFKTQNTKADKKITVYEDWLMQLAAYNAIEPADTFKVLVVSSTEQERVEVIEIDKKDIEDALNGFLGAVKLFKYLKKL